MTRKSDLQLDKAPAMIEEKETPKERLIKLRFFLAAEKASDAPSKAYIEDLNETISAIQMRIQ